MNIIEAAGIKSSSLEFDPRRLIWATPISRQASQHFRRGYAPSEMLSAAPA